MSEQTISYRRRLQRAVSVALVMLWSTSVVVAQSPIRRPEELLPLEAAIVDEEQLDLAVAQRDQTGNILTMAELAESPRGGSLHAGLYVANNQGHVFFHSTDEINTKRSVVKDLSLRTQDLRPLGMAFSYPYLYVYDRETRRVIALEPELRSLDPVHTFERRFERPSHLAVSSEGLVAVLDGNMLVLQERGREPFLYEVSEHYLDPAGLNFTSWDTLHVLDAQQRSLLTLTLNRLKGDDFRVRTKTTELPESLEFTAMTEFQGNLYFATETQVYSYLADEKATIPVLAPAFSFDGINQIALTHDGLYVLHHNILEWVPRFEPVDLVFEGSLHEARSTLYEVYRYLHQTKSLSLREERAGTVFEEAELLLAATGTLVGPPVQPPAEVVRTFPEQQKYGYQKTQIDLEQRAKKNVVGHRQFSRGGGPQREPGTSHWNELFCSLSNCDTFRTVRPGQSINVPDVVATTRLATERVLLTGSPLAQTLKQLVLSEQYQDRATATFVRRLNRKLAERSDEEIMALTTGLWTLPVERWKVTLALPAHEVHDPDSKLREILDADDRASLISRSAFVELSAKGTSSTRSAAGLQPDPPDHCALLRQSLDSLHDVIDYPKEFGDAWLTEEVRVGVLEHGSTAQDAHHAFRRGAESTAWHEVKDLTLSAKPTPASAAPLTVPVLELDAFSREAHHANHVAALIGGRQDECWSGLLPNAQLVLIDLSDGGKVNEQVKNAIINEVLVFNVSQVWWGDQDALWLTVRGDDRPLWVVAAGNDGKDFRDIPRAPAMAAWSELPNVISVAASLWDGNPIETVLIDGREIPGTNHGKKFVDLIAPGKDVVSAVWDNVYGPASGTSQATPQVSAAAALLVDPRGVGLSPGDAKARLIATAQWSPTYEGRVWGGRLDFDAAVAFPEIHTVRTRSGLGDLFAIEVDSGAEVILGKDEYYEKRGSGFLVNTRIPFDRILSLREHNGRYRVVLREPRSDNLKILLDVQLTMPNDGLLQCSRFDRWDEAQQAFVPTDGCDEGMSINQIVEYVRGEKYRIQWPED